MRMKSGESGGETFVSKGPLEKRVKLDGGRDRDLTCDPLDVNEVLSR